MHEIKINDRVTAVLTYDEDCQGPGDCMLGKIYYVKGSRYRLGTAEVSRDRLQDIQEGIESGELVGLPVYAYIHGNTQLSTTPFSCPFDSGLVGFIACSHEDIKSWFGEHHCKSTEEVLDILRSEVEEFSKFLQGDVYNITIYVDGKAEDTVGGFFGFDYAVEEAKELAEEHVKQLEKPVLPSQIKFDEYYYIANPCIFDLYSIIPAGMNTKSTLVFLAERGLVYRTKEEAVRHATSLLNPGIALVRQMCQAPTSLDDDVDEDPSCAFCAGTGEGQYDGQSCSYCKGKGY